MRPVIKAFLLFTLVAAAAVALALWYFLGRGVSAREQPGAVETFVAGRLRGMAISSRAKHLTNPVAYSGEMIAEARAHFADHCAQCHGNDGSGNTAMGQGLWPKPPDLRLARTQDLADGELFWIIENGVRFTGMPAWGSGKAESSLGSWQLVHFIRRLPKLTKEELAEMETLNPRSPAEIRQEVEEQLFREGKGPKPAAVKRHTHAPGKGH
jgi:mono/diheme cytochrome c family protein